MGTKGYQGSPSSLIRVAVLCSAMVHYASAAPVLVGLWRFDEAGGDTANDSSGLGHQGTLYGEQGNVPGRVAGQTGFGQALMFTNNGVDHCTVNVPGSPLLMIGMTPDDTWTISAWVLEVSDGFGNFVANYGRVFAQDGGLGLNLDSGANGDAEFWIWHNSLTAWQQGFGTGAAVVPVLDQWTHLALVYDGQNLTLYRNGNQGPLGAKTSLAARSSLHAAEVGKNADVPPGPRSPTATGPPMPVLLSCTSHA